MKRPQSTCAEPAQARHLPADPEAHHAVLVEAVGPDLEVLAVHVEDAVAELVHGALDVDHLPDQVRGVEVEAEVRRRGWPRTSRARSRARRRGCCRPATRRRRRSSGSSRSRSCTPRSPAWRTSGGHTSREVVEVLRQVRGRSLPGERPDRSTPSFAAPSITLRRWSCAASRASASGSQRVRVVGQRGDLQAAARERRRRSAAPRRRQRLDVDVRDARVAARGALPGGPAGDLERLEAVGGRPVGDLVERQSPGTRR